MIRHRIRLFLLLLMGSRACFAQFSDSQLYQAYLHRDMDMWEQYILSVDTATADTAERVRLLNYQYGYVAYSLSREQPEATLFLHMFRDNLAALHGQLPESTYLAYLSGLYSYELSLNRWQFAKYSRKIFSCINRALQLDPNDPLAQTMKGNTEFYNPMGSKSAALRCYLKADSIYHTQPQTACLWNVRAAQVTLVQCLEKTGQRQAAIRKCHELLQEEPDFRYIREEYLPALER